jgi:ribosomal protein L31
MSGFKISTESLRPEFYQVVITLSGGAGTYPTADGNDNGAVCPQDHSAFTTKPTTLAIGRRVARGHQRFLAIIENLQKYADAQIQDVQFTSSGATVADNQATAVTFTVRYDRGGNAGATTASTLDNLILAGTRSEIGTPFQFTATTDGTITVDTTAKALRWQVAQAIGRTNHVKSMRVYDGGQGAEIQESLTVTLPDTLADIYKDVAVTLVDAAETIDS